MSAELLLVLNRSNWLEILDAKLFFLFKLAELAEAGCAAAVWAAADGIVDPGDSGSTCKRKINLRLMDAY